MWYHHWYSDSFYSLNLSQDRLILDLTHSYLNYGTDHSMKLFWSSFWYKRTLKPDTVDLKSYYRWLPLYSEILRTTSYYPFRTSSAERFNTRASILRYNSWFILNLYWFQPDKVRQRHLRIAKPYRYTSTTFIPQRSSSILSKTVKLLSNPVLKCLQRNQRYRF